jgi:D-3-phosphoglycerate dehydrogenase / 2-oxoglutarate reductase
MKRVAFIDSVHPSLQMVLERNGFTCEMLYTLPDQEIIAKLPAYEGAVIRSRFRIDRTIIDKAAGLEFIARAGAGMENIDVAYAESKGIRCFHAPEGNRDAVGEQAIGMLLMLFNNLGRADRQVREEKWIREGNRGIELMGKTVGIIGYGNMGSAFAQRLKGFGVKVLAYDKYRSGFGDESVIEASLEDVFREADVLSLHVPLTDETRYMINDSFINRFVKNIFIINTARGKVLNTADLVKSMRSGKVLGACLDVLEYEAVSFENIEASVLPEPFQYLIKSDRVVLSPHIAGWTHESNEKIALALAGKIIALYGK